jgi:hypothetical protein
MPALRFSTGTGTAFSIYLLQEAKRLSKGDWKGGGNGGGGGRDKRLSKQTEDKQLNSPSLCFGEIDIVCHKSKATLPECS